MKSLVNFLSYLIGWGIVIAITVACFRNVFWQSTEQQRLAATTACGARPACPTQLRQFMRSPIGHKYEFVTPAGDVEVSCTREFLLFGDYACAVENSELASAASASASASAPASASASAPRPAVKPAVKPAVSGKPGR